MSIGAWIFYAVLFAAVGFGVGIAMAEDTSDGNLRELEQREKRLWVAQENLERNRRELDERERRLQLALRRVRIVVSGNETEPNRSSIADSTEVGGP